MSQEHPVVPGAVDQGSTCDTKRWRGVDHAGGGGRRDAEIRMLSKRGWSRRELAAAFSVTIAAVARVQRAGGAS